MTESYHDAFQHWARETVDAANADHPGLAQFDLEKFDGCTFGLDVCRHCCLIHDLRYWFRDGPRAHADRELRECIAAIGNDEDRFSWAWVGIAWVYWAAVRIGGSWFWPGGQARAR